MTGEPVPALAVGSRLGHYVIRRAVGAGGMGEVYEAEDTRLHRRIALKVVRHDVAADPVRRARLEREATAAATLNHPHVVTVHSLEDHDGVLFVTMELIEGATLAEALPPHGFPVERVLAIGMQLAEALGVAHAAGIVHRDLKPANVMVTRSGSIKVLDFGLSRVAVDEAAGTRTTMELSSSGALVGTAPYMSPEQIEGHMADARSDMFALGIVLFEMATGRRPFSGPTPMATLSAIAKDTPPLASAINPAVPQELARIIDRCLVKDPARRAQSALDLRAQLEDLARMLDSGRLRTGIQPEHATVAHRSTAPLRWILAVTATAVLAAAIAAVAVSNWNRPTPPVEHAPLIRLTSDSGLTMDAALSPDGRLVAYASDRAGNLDIWVQQVEAGTPIRLTSDAADESEPSFSPDGNSIVFRSSRDGGGIYIMPALGGNARLVAASGRHASFSPDGERIAFVTGGGLRSSLGGDLFVIPASGGAPRRLVEAETTGAAHPTWSPDGKLILFASGIHRPDGWGIVRTDSDSGTALSRVSLGGLTKTGLAELLPCEWLEANRVLFSAKSGDGSHLFETRLSPPNGTAEWDAGASATRLTFGTGLDERASFAASGSAKTARRLAFASLALRGNIWSVALDTEKPRLVAEAQRLTEDSGSQIFPHISRDGQKLVFISDAAHNDEVWLMDLTTGKRSLMSTSVSIKWKSRILPDGVQVYWGDAGGTTGNTTDAWSDDAVYAVASTGGLPRKLFDGCAWIWEWSTQHDRVLCHRQGPRFAFARIFDLETGMPSTFLERDGWSIHELHWSPDGRWIVFRATQSGRIQLWVAPYTGDRVASETEWIPITDGPVMENTLAWSPDGSWIYSMANRDGHDCIWAHGFDAKTKRPRGTPVAVYHLHSTRFSVRNTDGVSNGMDVARDKIVFNAGELTGNIWLTTLPQ